ncbi:MAG: aminoglycoside phosphotransferase family protein [Dehalococcoidia bacterium]|nr:aminoglycoside phosphotransferase family protein [Dehalococcoidia bacterium]MDD5493919.1 aminoglycoside phosphotransferase family protein [Dehalococcoidia bacterium]
MNLQDMTPLAVGRVSDVYTLKDGRVLKLLHSTVPGPKVDDEFRRCRIVFKAGVPSPQALEIVEVEGRQGIIFEWAGESDLMKARLGNPLNLNSGAQFMSTVHQDILKREGPELPDLKEEVLRMTRLLPEGAILPGQFEALGRYLDGLPSANSICHMDFQPGNIMLSKDGYQVIDWSEAVRGAPAADIALTSLILAMAETAPGTDLLRRIIIPIFRKAFEKRYRAHVTSHMGISEDSLQDWMLAAGIVRLATWNIATEREFLTGLIQAELKELESKAP